MLLMFSRQHHLHEFSTTKARIVFATSAVLIHLVFLRAIAVKESSRHIKIDTSMNYYIVIAAVKEVKRT